MRCDHLTLPAPATIASGGEKDKKESIFCCSCREELKADDQALAIKCSAGHYVCAKDPKVTDRCTTSFVQAQAETSYTPPIKCPVCPAPVVLPTFIRFLDDSQLSCHMIRVAMSTLQPGESLLECPNCRYSEICDCSTADIARLHCKFEGCGSVTCYVCKLQIGKLSWSDFDEGSLSPMADDASASSFEARAEEHLTSCFPLASLKFKFDEAMEWNSKFKCPTCNFGGQKDDACTHMKECPCAVPWCYFCQKILPSSMFTHNANWHGEAGRCPLFLEELHDFDSTWPADQDGCMQKLHRLVCLKKLKLLHLDVLNSSFAPVPAVHRRSDGESTTLLRAKADPSRSSHVFVVPNVLVRNGESVTVLRSNADGEAGWSWVRTAANAYGFLKNDYLSAVASHRRDQPPTLDDLCASFHPVSPQDILFKKYASLIYTRPGSPKMETVRNSEKWMRTSVQLPALLLQLYNCCVYEDDAVKHTLPPFIDNITEAALRRLTQPRRAPRARENERFDRVWRYLSEAVKEGMDLQYNAGGGKTGAKQAAQPA